MKIIDFMSDNSIEREDNAFILNIFAKISTQCDNCKSSIDTSKPKPEKSKDGKAKSKLNPAIKATLETTIDSGEVKEFHFCNEICLYNFLHKKYQNLK